jgi:polyhydroxyalkanoate synthase subunit PhaC
MLDMWGKSLAPLAAVGSEHVDPRDKRFAGPEWDHPAFDLMRQGYAVMSKHMMGAVEAMDDKDPVQKAKMAFAVRTIVEAMSPANSPFTNPLALNKMVETNGVSLMSGISHLMTDMQRGQLTHTDPNAFEVGRNIAITPGKVIKETPLYQLIQYAPATPDVLAVPLVIFPPWINRYYILDLNPEKSFIRWAVEQGVTVFVVSWKSADASMKDVIWDDYILHGQIDAIDSVRALFDVPAVHTIGYCVAGTTLAATLALLEARGQADKIKSATFFTAQVDFADSGELLTFIDDTHFAMIDSLVKDGYLDGRYMALTFNMLRGRDLIWSYVANNYLLGNDYPAFDLLHWNGDTTNLPAKWHRSYLTDLYRDNRLTKPGSLSVGGVPIDLRTVNAPCYIQAGRDDHIAPVGSVWKIMENFSGPMKFVLAGSGHIAGVVNPPSSGKYQYWLGDNKAASLADFIAGAVETKGSWWPNWIDWLREQDGVTVPAGGARVPGQGTLPVIEDAPGRYAKTR